MWKSHTFLNFARKKDNIFICGFVMGAKKTKIMTPPPPSDYTTTVNKNLISGVRNNRTKNGILLRIVSFKVGLDRE